MTKTPRLFGGILPYEAEVAEPNGPRIRAWVLADYSDHCQKLFEAWLAEHDREMLASMTKQRAAEAAELGHECGHLFTIRVTTRGHYSVNGDPEHRDAPEGDGDDMPWTLTVRAHNLRDAMLVAALTPLGEWSWPGQDEADDEDDS